MDRILAALKIDAADAFHLGLIWLSAWAGWQVVRLITRRMVAAATSGEHVTVLHEKRAKTVASLLRSTGGIVLVLLAIVSSLGVLKIDIFPITAVAGVAGLAISFGAQSLVKDLITGVFILIENQFAVGDVIEVAGKSGTVERMTLRVVMLRDIEGVVHIIPNGQITTVSNRTRGWSRAVVDVGIAYGSDLEHSVAALKEEAAALAADLTWSSQFDAPPEVVGIENIGENGVTVRVLLRTKPGMQADVAREFRRRVLTRFEREGIKAPSAQQAIHIHQAAAT